MKLDEAEARLAQERVYLIHAERTGTAPAIALAQAHVAQWESEVFRLRLAEDGGWRAPKHEIRRQS